MNSQKIVYKRKFSERLRSLIEEGGVVQAELCRKIGISPSKLTNYLNGSIPDDPSILEKIAKNLNVTIDFLLTGKEEKGDTSAGVISEGQTSYEVSNWYGLSSDEKILVGLYRTADQAAREDALNLLERHQVVPGEEKQKQPKQKETLLEGDPSWTKEDDEIAATNLGSQGYPRDDGTQIHKGKKAGKKK